MPCIIGRRVISRQTMRRGLAVSTLGDMKSSCSFHDRVWPQLVEDAGTPATSLDYVISRQTMGRVGCLDSGRREVKLQLLNDRVWPQLVENAGTPATSPDYVTLAQALTAVTGARILPHQFSGGEHTSDSCHSRGPTVLACGRLGHYRIRPSQDPRWRGRFHPTTATRRPAKREPKCDSIRPKHFSSIHTSSPPPLLLPPAHLYEKEQLVIPRVN